jgi:hypothetical protein
VRALPLVAKREVGKAEADAAGLIVETISLLIAPARAASKALGRLVEADDTRARARGPGSRPSAPGRSR